MLSRFEDYLAARFPFLKGKKLLLAVSGGIDSMVMAALFSRHGYSTGIAHCNFQLREQESMGDEEFVRAFAVTAGIPFYSTRFDTMAFALDYRVSVQAAARELRYNWFAELLDLEQYDYLLTAHHADDNLETFLINFSRGTGLEGLTGIPEQNGNIVRPLLAFPRYDLELYAAQNNIRWREDSSNASDKYVRNKIRHGIAPLLKELNPGFLNSFNETLGHLRQSQSLVEDAAVLVYQQVVTEEENSKKIDIKKLRVLPNFKAYLYQWLRPFGFTAWEDIHGLTEGQSGKQVFSENFRLLRDRDFLILAPWEQRGEAEEYYIHNTETEVNFPLKLLIRSPGSIPNASNTAIFVDEKKLAFPLVLRRWREGDTFQPLGMQGRAKKVSKFFKDEKLSLIEKENTWILCSGPKIIWIVGMRQDERFKINETTQNILEIALLQ